MGCWYTLAQGTNKPFLAIPFLFVYSLFSFHVLYSLDIPPPNPPTPCFFLAFISFGVDLFCYLCSSSLLFCFCPIPGMDSLITSHSYYRHLFSLTNDRPELKRSFILTFKVTVVCKIPCWCRLLIFLKSLMHLYSIFHAEWKRYVKCKTFQTLQTI